MVSKFCVIVKVNILVAKAATTIIKMMIMIVLLFLLPLPFPSPPAATFTDSYLDNNNSDNNHKKVIRSYKLSFADDSSSGDNQLSQMER